MDIDTSGICIDSRSDFLDGESGPVSNLFWGRDGAKRRLRASHIPDGKGMAPQALLLAGILWFTLGRGSGRTNAVYLGEAAYLPLYAHIQRRIATPIIVDPLTWLVDILLYADPTTAVACPALVLCFTYKKVPCVCLYVEVAHQKSSQATAPSSYNYLPVRQKMFLDTFGTLPVSSSNTVMLLFCFLSTRVCGPNA